jgi:hypothetical protein
VSSTNLAAGELRLPFEWPEAIPGQIANTTVLNIVFLKGGFATPFLLQEKSSFWLYQFNVGALILSWNLTAIRGRSERVTPTVKFCRTQNKYHRKKNIAEDHSCIFKLKIGTCHS